MTQDEAPRSPRPDLGTLWRHRALVGAAVYAFVALVGALYYVLLLGNFGVNPFLYWEASDFLLATFRAPVAIVFGLLALLIYISITRSHEINDLLFGSVPWVRRLLRYDRWRDSRLMAPQFGPLAGTLFALLWFVIVMGAVATGAAAEARRGEGEVVGWATEGEPVRSAVMLTTTNRFVFLVAPGATPRDARLIVVPVEALARVDHCGSRRGGLRALLRGVELCEPAATVPVPAAPTVVTTPAPAPGTAVPQPAPTPTSAP